MNQSKRSQTLKALKSKQHVKVMKHFCKDRKEFLLCHIQPSTTKDPSNSKPSTGNVFKVVSLLHSSRLDDDQPSEKDANTQF